MIVCSDVPLQDGRDGRSPAAAAKKQSGKGSPEWRPCNPMREPTASEKKNANDLRLQVRHSVD